MPGLSFKLERNTLTALITESQIICPDGPLRKICNVIYICVSGLLSLHRELKRTFKAAYAEGTFRNLKTQWISYVSFCVFYGLKHLSKDPWVLCLYVQLLSHSFVSKGAIENYLSGARTYFRLSDKNFDSIERKMG